MFPFPHPKTHLDAFIWHCTMINQKNPPAGYEQLPGND